MYPVDSVMKYIVVTGGVLSGIGKGLIASSIGLLLRTHGLRVTCIKIDPYLNIDAGTLSPLDHGTLCFPRLDSSAERDCRGMVLPVVQPWTDHHVNENKARFSY